MDSQIPIKDFHYYLPPDRIAYYPLPDRDQSKLLVYKKGTITHADFKSIVNFIPENAILFFNDTRVIPARLYFSKETGATVEIFLLNPIAPSVLLAEAMNARGLCSWHCTIGNLKRWKEQASLEKRNEDIHLKAILRDKENGIVDFTWSPNHLSFAEVISKTGNAPLPPYIKREIDPDDKTRYQTIYARREGAVAAPTAGLHFTDHVLEQLKRKGIKKDFLTLHVSAGTFQPVKTNDATEHVMHTEQIVVTLENVQNLLQKNAFILPVGTTSMRTLESLYWFGVKLLRNPDAEFVISQTEPYEQNKSLPIAEEALTAVLDSFSKRNTPYITGHTAIYIYPGYSLRVCQGLVTNFHLPGSTLMLLVAALVGDSWKTIYQEALDNQYRFLSYGDSSLLLP